MAYFQIPLILVLAGISTTLARTTQSPPLETTTKSPTAETTPKPFNCSLEHRKHPTSDNMFQKVWNDVWTNYTCPLKTLVWNQDTCRCEQGPGDTDPCGEYSPVPDSPEKYIRTVWGRNFTLACGMGMVWSQDSCTCRFALPGEFSAAGAAVAPCEVMLESSFDTGFDDDARGSYIGRYPWSSAQIIRESGIVGTGAVCLKKGYLTVPAFTGNELSRVFQIQFRVRVDEDDESEPSNGYTVLVSNGCARDNPSIAIGYRPSDRTYVVGISDSSENVTMTCSDTGVQGGWRLISLEVTREKVVFRVNGRNCVIDERTALTDQPRPTRCPLSFGGDARAVSKKITGCFDEVVVRRYCIEQ